MGSWWRRLRICWGVSPVRVPKKASGVASAVIVGVAATEVGVLPGYGSTCAATDSPSARAAVTTYSIALRAVAAPADATA